MKNNIFDIKNKVVVITGASGQIGKELSIGLARYGSKVVVSDINIKKGKKIVQDIKKLNGKSIFSYLNVRNVRTIKETVKKTLDKFGKIDVLINNAGITVTTDFLSRTETVINKILAVNITGVIQCSKLFLSEMIKARNGIILNIASVYGIRSPDPLIYGNSGRNSSEIYGMSKSAVIQFTKYLAVHYAKYGIRANCISPGGIFNKQDHLFVKKYSEKTALKRMGLPSDILGSTIFFISDASSYITGHNLVIDGGFTVF